MTNFHKRTNQLHNNHFGLGSKLGTIDALISVVCSIRYNLNKSATLIFQPHFTAEKAKLSMIGCKDSAHRFGESFILGSADLLESFY